MAINSLLIYNKLNNFYGFSTIIEHFVMTNDKYELHHFTPHRWIFLEEQFSDKDFPFMEQKPFSTYQMSLENVDCYDSPAHFKLPEWNMA